MEIKENNPYKNIKCVKEFNKNEDCIVYLLRLKNGNLITCSQDKEMRKIHLIYYYHGLAI